MKVLCRLSTLIRIAVVAAAAGVLVGCAIGVLVLPSEPATTGLPAALAAVAGPPEQPGIPRVRSDSPRDGGDATWRPTRS